MVLTDNGKQFVGTIFAKLLTEYNITHNKTIPYNPQGNSIIERSHSTLINSLRQLKNENIDQALHRITYAYNAIVSTSTGFSPMQLAFGRSCFPPSEPENIEKLYLEFFCNIRVV